MKIFTGEDIRKIVGKTVAAEGLSLRQLAGRVADGVVAEVTSRWRPTKRTAVFAGPGLNGAYALA
ncbi:MAG: bifunctional ADP-dependent NAD(P)H-hydrate dehydratase/NAD(P)H-hydrate epimerase, partial [Paramuribaculum sp.]|nr:bifunctional ADP-dependent NAD(P)H-hydrate dehydratase/NAD(P)H-hydrate epimerase [Paramuribaculum sp.]